MPDSVNVNKNEDIVGEKYFRFPFRGRSWDKMSQILRVFLSFSSGLGLDNQQGIFKLWTKQRKLGVWLTCMIFKKCMF